MSYMEYHIGKLTPIECLDVEAKCKELIQNTKYAKYRKDYSSWEELLHDFGDDYKVLNGILYSIDDNPLDESESTATIDENGVVSYSLSFYNGGCGFGEALEDTVKEVLDKELEKAVEAPLYAKK